MLALEKSEWIYLNKTNLIKAALILLHYFLNIYKLEINENVRIWCRSGISCWIWIKKQRKYSRKISPKLLARSSPICKMSARNKTRKQWKAFSKNQKSGKRLPILKQNEQKNLDSSEKIRKQWRHCHSRAVVKWGKIDLRLG